MGVTRVVYTTAAPLGCYPYILTALPSSDPTDYDGLGCLTAVNRIAIKFNNDLQTAFLALRTEFPSVTIIGADYYVAVRALITEKTVSGKSCYFRSSLIFLLLIFLYLIFIYIFTSL